LRTENLEILILGGGLTGLTIGYLLNPEIEFEVLEKEKECGGLMRRRAREKKH